MSGLEPVQSSPAAPPAKGAWGGMRRIGDVWQRLGTSGAITGTNGRGWRVFLATLAIAAVVVGVVDTINVVTRLHEEPRVGLAESIIWEATSWLTWLGFLWIGWLAFRIGPPRRPFWRLIVHIPGAFLFAFGHVGGFIILRKLVYAAAGSAYHVGHFWPYFSYEFSKDAFGYVLMIAAFAINERVFDLIAQSKVTGEAMFPIRDGTRIVRVPFADIVAVTSAGNYVEFVLRDGRRPLMRAPLSQIESRLAPNGFVRVHRSWLVNPSQMTALRPDGSGDYTIELGAMNVPLSRRFPEALARLRAN
jgi:hypothetical protein